VGAAGAEEALRDASDMLGTRPVCTDAGLEGEQEGG